MANFEDDDDDEGAGRTSRADRALIRERTRRTMPTMQAARACVAYRLSKRSGAWRSLGPCTAVPKGPASIDADGGERLAIESRRVGAFRILVGDLILMAKREGEPSTQHLVASTVPDSMKTFPFVQLYRTVPNPTPKRLPVPRPKVVRVQRPQRPEVVHAHR